MTGVFHLHEIAQAVSRLDLVPAIEASFVAYSEGRAVIPPVGELSFKDPPGDVHIKYGRIIGDDVYVVKVASGFYDNPRHGLPGNSGVMMVFSSATGILQSLLLDEGYLTNVRTAIAGAICSKFLAPSSVAKIAILGTGVQARMQAEETAKMSGCRRLAVWGRSDAALDAYQSDMEARGFQVATTRVVGDATRDADIVITTTAAEIPILRREHIEAGTHIVAMGSDTETKNEIAVKLLGAVDVYVADSLSQCQTRGELHHALKAGTRSSDDAVELGCVIVDPRKGRSNDQQITLADLTGVAVQDIAIAKAVCAAMGESA